MTAGNTFRTSRVLPHGPAAVFAAFAEPGMLAAWWGPNGFTNEFEVVEFRPGGRWKFVMIGPDGARHPNESVFGEIEEPSRVVIRHMSAPQFTLTVDLTKVPGGTRIDWTQVFENAAVAAALKHIVEPANEQNLDRLGAVLARREGPPSSCPDEDA
jgi:uncharacterized protein YndB with AHSA1/START domain